MKIVTDKDDNRRRTVVLTKAGYDLHDQIIQVALERERRLLVDLSKTEVDALVKLLRRLHENLEYVNSYAPDLGEDPKPHKRKAKS